MKEFKRDNVTLLLGDCVDYMKDLPDNAFDLAIVDPPYGISEPAFRRNDVTVKKASKTKKYHTAVYKQKAPTVDYFGLLRNVSKNQIIWGGNYFGVPPSRCWIVWDKVTQDAQWADAELAYTSFTSSVRIFKFAWNGMIQGNMKNKENRIHPTQKPVALYKWLLKNYAKETDRIIDTHLGSGSSAIAAWEYKCKEFVGIEIDEEYFSAAVKRFDNHTRQQKLF